MTLSRQGYLKAMGIEVWTLRPATPPASSPQPAAAPAAAPKVSKASKFTGNPAAPPLKKSAPPKVPSFRLALLDYNTVGMCLSLDEGEELPRRFCDDVARAMNGRVESVRYQLLQWPMLNTSGIDQSIDTAREVVTQKFRMLPPKLLVFGEDVAEYFNPLKDMTPMTVNSVGAQSFLLVPSLPGLMRSGPSKRQLMLAIDDWRVA